MIRSNSTFAGVPYVVREFIVELYKKLRMIPVQDFQVNNPDDSPREYNFIFLDKKSKGQVITIARQRARVAQKMMKEIYPFVALNHKGSALTVTMRYKALSGHYESLLDRALINELERIQLKMKKK